MSSFTQITLIVIFSISILWYIFFYNAGRKEVSLPKRPVESSTVPFARSPRSNYPRALARPPTLSPLTPPPSSDVQSFSLWVGLAAQQIARNAMELPIQRGLCAAVSSAFPTQVRPENLSPISDHGVQIHYSFFEYEPETFQQIRTTLGIEPRSLPESFCEHDLEVGSTNNAGKSGSLFWRSSDKEYLLKSLPEDEATALIQMASEYNGYLRSNPD